MAPSHAAIELVRSQLVAMDIGDDASIRHLALTEAGLRAVAPEVSGVFSTLADSDATKGMEAEDAYAALVHVRRMSAYGADRWVAEQGRQLAAPAVAAAVPVVPAAALASWTSPVRRSRRSRVQCFQRRRLLPPPALPRRWPFFLPTCRPHRNASGARLLPCLRAFRLRAGLSYCGFGRKPVWPQ